MKRLNFFLLALASVGLLFTSCEPTTDAVGPSLQITTGESVSASAGSTIVIAWRADAGDANMATISVLEGNTAITSGGITWDSYDIPNASNETYVDSVSVHITAATSFTITVTDNDGLTASKTVNVTIGGSSGGAISTYTQTLGSWNEATASSFASIDGSAMTKTQVQANATKVDFMYFYGSSNQATLAAPANTDAQSVYSWLSTLSKNDTKFGTTSISATDFDAMTNDTQILTAAASLSASKINMLAVGDVIAFKTASTSAHANKAGLVKITAINGGDASAGTGTITFVVKVQQ
jgi:hypothetical protein